MNLSSVWPNLISVGCGHTYSLTHDEKEGHVTEQGTMFTVVHTEGPINFLAEVQYWVSMKNDFSK